MQDSGSGSETEVDAQLCGAFRQTIEGEPHPKQRDMRDVMDRPLAMCIETLVDPPPEGLVALRQSKRKKKATKEKVSPRKLTSLKILADQEEQYDLLARIAHANMGLSIVQLLLGEATEAVTKVKKLLGGRTSQ